MAKLCNIPSFTHSFYEFIKHWVQRYRNAALVISSHTGCASEKALFLPPPQIILFFLQPSSPCGPRSGQVSLSPLGHTSLVLFWFWFLKKKWLFFLFMVFFFNFKE